MATCRGCGAEALRTCASFSPAMEFVKEVCPECSPETFQGVNVTDPSDRKIWDGFEVEPHLYSSPDSENVVHAKDELRQDIWNEFNRDPDQEARELKRRTRRTEPLSATEIEQANQWAERVLRPVLEQATRS